jgi:hypothetical protein
MRRQLAAMPRGQDEGEVLVEGSLGDRLSFAAGTKRKAWFRMVPMENYDER